LKILAIGCKLCYTPISEEKFFQKAKEPLPCRGEVLPTSDSDSVFQAEVTVTGVV
jgi:hypothetical protein